MKKLSRYLVVGLFAIFSACKGSSGGNTVVIQQSAYPMMQESELQGDWVSSCIPLPNDNALYLQARGLNVPVGAYVILALIVSGNQYESHLQYYSSVSDCVAPGVAPQFEMGEVGTFIFRDQVAALGARQIQTTQTLTFFESSSSSGTYCGLNFSSGTTHLNAFDGVACDGLHDFSEIIDEDLVALRSGRLVLGVETSSDAYPSGLEESIAFTKL